MFSISANLSEIAIVPVSGISAFSPVLPSYKCITLSKLSAGIIKFTSLCSIVAVFISACFNSIVPSCVFFIIFSISSILFSFCAIIICSLYENTSSYCADTIPVIESFNPKPAVINAVQPVIPTIVIIPLFLYLNKFLAVIF